MSAGCGSVKDSHLADAPVAGDAGADAATRGTVRVTVLDPGGTGAPAVGANVVFLDPDGSLVKRAATDTAGKASADLLPGASVTAIVLVNTRYELQTVLAVKPGDDLVIGARTADSSAAGDFTITYPAFGGATSYAVVTPCNTTFFAAPATGAAPAPAKITIFNSCKVSPMEIVVVPQGANGSLTSIAKAGVAFVAGGATTIGGGYQGLRNFTGSYTNINPIITNLNMSRAVPDAFGFTDSQSVATPGATEAINVTGPLATGGQVVTQVSASIGSAQLVRQTISGSGATYGLDVGATLLPWLKLPSYDAASGKLVVPVDTTGTSTAKPDVFRIAATYRRTDAATKVTTTFVWTLYGPEAGDIVLPTLPPELGGIGPTATDTVGISGAGMIEADTVSGYDAIRNDLNGAFSLYGGERPPAGTVRFSRAPSVRVL